MVFRLSQWQRKVCRKSPRNIQFFRLIPAFCLTAIAAVAFAVLSCNSPTLPLPPPSQGAIQATLDASGDSVAVKGKRNSVEPNALVTCFNNRTGTGVVVLADDTGAFSTKLSASHGDTIEIWQKVGNEPPSVSFSVK